MSDYDEYGTYSSPSPAAPPAAMPTSLPPSMGHPGIRPAMTINRTGSNVRPSPNFKINQRPINTSIPPPQQMPVSPSMPPQQPHHQMMSTMTSSSDTDEYGQPTGPAPHMASTPVRFPNKIQPRPVGMSGRIPSAMQSAAPPPPQALGSIGGDTASNVDEYGTPRAPATPMTASGRAPPTGKFSSPIIKQHMGKGGIGVPRISALGNESLNVSMSGGDSFGSGQAAGTVPGGMAMQPPSTPKHAIMTSADQDDEYGSTPLGNSMHMPMKQAPFPMASSPAGSAPVESTPRRVVPAFKPSTLHKTAPLATSAPPLEMDNSNVNIGGGGGVSPSIPPPSIPAPAAVGSGSGEETLNVLMKKGSVMGYNTEPVKRKPKEKVKPKSLITIPKHLSESQYRGLYSLNSTNRSDWKAKVLAENPNIVGLYERIYPLERGIAFCKLFHPGQRAVKEEMKRTQVVQLILQHLQLKGFNATRRVLEKESNVMTPRHRLHTSRLNSFIHSAIRDTDAVYDYVVGEKIDFGKQIEDRLWQMGLQEEEEENEDVDIWEEVGNNVEYETKDDSKGNVKCGSFNKLVELLTGNYTIDHPDYLPMFMLTYQSFSTPEKLLQKMVQRFNVPQAFVAAAAAGQGQLNPAIIKNRVCNILKKWIEDYPSDFDEKLNVQVKQFIDFASTNKGTAAVIASVNNSFQKMLAESKSPKKAQRFGEPPEPIIPQNFFSRRWDQWLPMELDEEEIARQLSLMDWEYFSKIRPNELLNQAWSKPKLKHRAPNVLAFIAQFNRTSAWAATEIMTAPNIKERVKVVTKLVKISEKLAGMNNFNSLMSISAALNCSSVSRLKHTFADLPPNVAKGKKDIEELVSSDGNFKILRQRIAAVNLTNAPCIPYLGYILSDLTFTDENPDKINGMINFNKRVMVYKIISGITSRQKVPFNFQPVQQIVRILRNVPIKPENELYELSLKHEPRGAQRNQIK